MADPAALAKAQALARYSRGQRREYISLSLTDREAWEFLDWYRGQLPDPTCFDAEVRQAKAFNDPWGVMQGILILGFEAARLDEEIH